MLHPPGGSHWQLRGKELPRSCVGFQIVGISDAMLVGLKMCRPSHPLSCGIDFVLCVYPWGSCWFSSLRVDMGVASVASRDTPGFFWCKGALAGVSACQHASLSCQQASRACRTCRARPVDTIVAENIY